MKVRYVMTAMPYVCTGEQTIAQVAHELLLHNINGVPVVNPDRSLAGLVGKKQLYKAIDAHINFDTPVRKVMEKDVVSVTPETELEELYTLKTNILPVIEDGRVVGIVTQSDITQDYNSNQLNTSMRMEAIIGMDNSGILGIDDQGKIVIFNNAAEQMFNMSKQLVIGKPYREIFSKGKLDEVLETNESALNQKTSYMGITFLSNHNPIIMADKTIGAVEVFQDISKIENLSHELEYIKKSKAGQDAIFEASFDSIFLTDAKGNVLMVNDAYTRITGIKAEELIGHNMYDMVNEGIYDRSATVMVIEKHKSVTFTQKIKNGKTLLVTGNPIFDEEGELVSVLTNGRDITELNLLKQEVEQAYSLSKHYEDELKRATMRSGEMIVNSKKTMEILDLVVRLGKVDTTVLVYGDSGVGKELVVRELHKNSLRKNKPFISINCAAIPESLLESELFGYDNGAFTGALKGGKMGTFEIANGGTLFLDEIGELPLNLQAKLLRAIQEKEITRIGGSSSIKVDVRIITATNRNLWDMVRERQFREDLYYRLNVVPIFIPPLKDRKEEIPTLAYHFLKIFNEKYNLQKTIDEELMGSLIDYDWPGNVRELKNVIERAIVTSPDSVIESINIGASTNRSDKKVLISVEGSPKIDLKERVNSYEEKLIKEYIKTYKTSRKAAKALGVSQTTIVRKAAEYGINLKGR